jgi:hypothetical protein
MLCSMAKEMSSPRAMSHSLEHVSFLILAFAGCRSSSIVDVLGCLDRCLSSTSALFLSETLYLTHICFRDITRPTGDEFYAGATLFTRKNIITLHARKLTCDSSSSRCVIFSLRVRQYDKLILRSPGCTTTQATCMCPLYGEIRVRIRPFHRRRAVPYILNFLAFRTKRANFVM